MSDDLLAGKKVLLVDDEELIREILSERFQMWGATTIEASGGIQAFEILKQENFDLVVTDIKMPEGDGFALINKINNNLGYKPVIFVATAFTDAVPESIEQLGVQYVFPKPLHFDKVEQALMEIFNKV